MLLYVYYTEQYDLYLLTGGQGSRTNLDLILEKTESWMSCLWSCSPGWVWWSLDLTHCCHSVTQHWTDASSQTPAGSLKLLKFPPGLSAAFWKGICSDSSESTLSQILTPNDIFVLHECRGGSRRPRVPLPVMCLGSVKHQRFGVDGGTTAGAVKKTLWGSRSSSSSSCESGATLWGPPY